MPRRYSPFREGLTKGDKLLALLLDRAAHSTKELVRRVGHRFGSLIHRLRKSGHTIKREKHPTKKHQYQYRYKDGD